MLRMEEIATPEGAMKGQLVIGSAVSPGEEEDLKGKKRENGAVYYPRPSMSTQAKSLFVARSTQSHLCPGCMSQLRNEKWHGMCTCSRYLFVDPPGAEPKTAKTDSGFPFSSYQVLDPLGKEVLPPERKDLWLQKAPADVVASSADSEARRSPYAIVDGPPGAPGMGGTEGFSVESGDVAFRTPPMPGTPALAPPSPPPPPVLPGGPGQDSFFRGLYLVVLAATLKVWALAMAVVWPKFMNAAYLCLAYWLIHRFLVAFSLYVKTPGVTLNVFFMTAAGEFRERIVVR